MPVTKKKAGVGKPRTRRRKGTARKIKLRKCGGCNSQLKGAKKALKTLSPPKRSVLKKCKAKEVFIPAVLVSQKVNPKLKKGMCMAVPTGARKIQTPGTKTPGTKNPKQPTKPVKRPVVKQPGKKKVVMPKQKVAKKKAT